MQITAEQLAGLFSAGGLLDGAKVAAVNLTGGPSDNYSAAEIHMKSRGAGDALLLLTASAGGLSARFVCTKQAETDEERAAAELAAARAMAREIIARNPEIFGAPTEQGAEGGAGDA